MKTYIKGIPLTWQAPKKQRNYGWVIIPLVFGDIVIWCLAGYGLYEVLKQIF